MLRAIILIFILVGCADPRYAPEPAPVEPGSLDVECAIQLKRSGTCLQLEWEAPPAEGREARLRIEPLSPTQRVTGIRASLWMPSMGHGSAPVRVTTLDGGNFLLTNLHFIMRGHWELRFEVELEDGPDAGVYSLDF